MKAVRSGRKIGCVHIRVRNDSTANRKVEEIYRPIVKAGPIVVWQIQPKKEEDAARG